MKLSFTGTVIKHLGRGRELGYPTANIPVAADAVEGTFVGLTEWQGRKYKSIIFIGAPATFGEKDKRLETHLLDFSQVIYGEQIMVEILRKLRDNRKFSSKEELVAQMKRDEQAARDYFAKP